MVRGGGVKEGVVKMGGAADALGQFDHHRQFWLKGRRLGVPVLLGGREI